MSDALSFAVDNIGVPLLRNILDNGDPRQFSNSRVFFIDLLGGNVQFEIALLDIKQLQDDVAQLQIDVQNLDTKVEWYHRIDRIFAAMSDITDVFAQMSSFVEQRILTGIPDETIAKDLDTKFAGPGGEFNLSRFDSHLKLIHRVIMDLDINFNPTSPYTIFDAYEAFMASHNPRAVTLGNPRAYFNERLKVYRHFAAIQRKCATLAALHFRTRDNANLAAGAEIFLGAALGAQYEAFLKAMPLSAQTAAVSDGGLRLVIDNLTLSPSPRHILEGRERDKDFLVPLIPGFALQTRADAGLSGIKDAKFLLVETGEDDFGLTFDVFVTGTFFGQEGVWTTYFSAPQKTYDGLLSNNQSVFTNMPHLSVGRQVEGRRVQRNQIPALGRMMFDISENALASAPASDQTLSISLGMVVPTLRELIAGEISGRTKGDEFSYDNILRVRIAERSPFGVPGARIIRRTRKRNHDLVFVPGTEPDFPEWKAGDADETEGVTQRPEGFDPVPQTPSGAYVLEWGRSFSDSFTQRGVWRPGFAVRYKVLAENAVARSPGFGSVAPSKGRRADADAFFSAPDSRLMPLIAVPGRDFKTQRYRLYRQFQGDRDYFEVTHMDMLDDFGPKGETVLVDLGGWVD